ncbi:hypothetical protein ABT337_07400 [Saccharopolyspora hirsuta]|uniref:Spore coat protein n=1 Tax=Saccharopolyspora hirsuta TaxID=1837 RepID=A0A5M7BXU0_SACHI|nr:spore coat protein [Saccharopolyspora hirsuta]KAA5835076.1 spore coat protein [Saccharopolyspora hirsuta]
MSLTDLRHRVVVFRADASTGGGAGHVVRCLSLAEEVAARGAEAVFVADLGDVDWLRAELRERELAVHAPPSGPEAFADQLTWLGAAAAVIDSYHLEPDLYRAAREVVPVLASYDRYSGPLPADVLVDQTFGAHRDPLPPGGAVVLRGPDYVLLRDRIRAARPALPPRARELGEPPRVLLVLGGTDALDVTGDLARIVLASCPSIRLSVIGRGVRAEEFDVGPDQAVEVVPPTPDLPRLMAEADLVVSAAGTTLGELCCVGAAVAALWVVDNQLPVYEHAVAAGCVHGLGSLTDVLGDPGAAGASVRELLENPERRSELAQTAWRLVDGHGRSRAVDALESLLVPVDRRTRTAGG